MPIEIRELVIRAVVLTVSDACANGERKDTSGEILAQLLRDLGAEIVATRILSDEPEPLVDALKEFADWRNVNLIVTTGGTGLGPRDNTPEATCEVIERAAPGLSEAMRIETLKQTPMAMLSRGVCGVRSGALIVNLPGSPKGVRESFAVIAPVLKHAIALIAGHPGGDLH
ncbi:MAG: MogA/MoaB family molybdenum cofactor biosynthesis protein [Acidobacteriota bacterium]